MATPKNPSDIAAKWARNLGAATQSIQAGVQAVTVNPAQSALAQVNAYVQGVQAAVNSGKYQRGLQRVTLQSWQNAMLTKGLNRIAAGASAAQPKMEAFMTKFMPYLQGLQSQLAATPRGDLQTNIQRAVTAMQYIANFKYQ